MLIVAFVTESKLILLAPRRPIIERRIVGARDNFIQKASKPRKMVGSCPKEPSCLS